MWGTGTPRREFLHVDDMARASLFVFDMDRDTYQANTDPMLSHLNVGSGTDIAIGELAQLVARVTGYKGRIENDLPRPDGTMRKLMSSDKLMAMGWRPQVDLERGVAETYQWFLENRAG